VSGEETRFGSLDARSPVGRGFSREEFRRLESLAKDLGRGLAPKPIPPSVDRRIGGVQRVAESPEDVPLEQKAALLEKADKAARLHPAVRQVSLTYGERVKRVGIVSSDGKAAREDRVYVSFVVQVTAEKNGLIQTATEVVGGMRGWELFREVSPEEAARRAARRAVEKLAAPPAPLGEMPVVLAAEAGGTMIHEAIGHALEADAIQEGSSPHFAGKVGAAVAHEKVTVLDDPTMAGARGSFAFDDEGVPAERTVLVERGVLKTYLYDRLTARKEGRASNGHGRREDYRFKPIPRMSNTFVISGPDDPKEILASLQQGLPSPAWAAAR
jgi:TldD protein